MRKTDLFVGFFIGLLVTFVGVFAFVEIFTDYHFSQGLQLLKANGSLGKLITVGAILNLVAFFGLLKFKKDLMARGVIFATIFLAILTIFL
jgi:hypothetical protein